MSDRVLLEGIISVSAAVSSKKREIYSVFIDKEKIKKRDRKIMFFQKLLSENGIRAELCDRSLIDSYAASESNDVGNSNGGVIAFCSEREYTPLNELLKKQRTKNSYSVFLDGVEDPYNFGYCLRSLYACGAAGVVIPKRNWMSAANVCARASAGASELIDLCEMPFETDAELCEFLKRKSISIVCAAKNSASVSYTDFVKKGDFMLFIGGEKRGISKEFMENAADIIHIPYADETIRYSLPTASVASIIGFELQRNLNKF